MAPTIFIKFCGLIAHSEPNNMVLSAFLGKIPETGKMFLNFFPSPNVRAELTDQPRLNSTCRVL